MAPAVTAKAKAAADKKAKEKEVKEEVQSESDDESESDQESEEEEEEKENKPDVKKLKTEASQSVPVAQPPSIRTNNRSWKNLPFPKGTFVLRLSDVPAGDQFNWVWKVDNHQLIQKYLKEEGTTEQDPKKIWYLASNRYSGWLTNEAWRFMNVDVSQQKKTNNNEERVQINWPSKEKVDAALQKIKAEEAKQREEKEKNGGGQTQLTSAPVSTASNANGQSKKAKAKEKKKKGGPPSKKSKKARKEEESDEEEDGDESPNDDNDEEVVQAPVKKRATTARASKAKPAVK